MKRAETCSCIYVINYTYLYHHTVVLDKYTNSNLVYYKYNGDDETYEHKLLLYNKFIIYLYMFRTLCAHQQEVKLYCTASGIVTVCRSPSGAQVERVLSHPAHRTATYRVWRYQMLYNILRCTVSKSPLSTCAPDGHLQSVTIPDAV